MRRRRLHYRVAALLAAIASPPASVAGECPAVQIRVVPSYQAPRGFEYATKEELRTRSRTGEEPLGIIETAVGWDVDVGIRQRCLGDECRLCVSRIEGNAGFGSGRMRVAATLRGDRCRTDAVLEHEARHARVFDESTRLGVRRLVDTLRRWAAQQTALVAAGEEVEVAAKARYDEIERMVEEGVAWMERQARARNERIDSPRAYEAVLESMERRCRAIR